MDLLDNPFLLLGATPRDNRHRIMELAEERSLLSDEDVVSSARGTLTNPRNRLSAEIAWLPGVGPSRASETISIVQDSPRNLLELTNIPALARANLLSAGLNRVAGDLDGDDLSEWITTIAEVFDEIDAKSIQNLINEEREVSGFPAVSDEHAFESELHERRQHYRATIRDALNSLSPDTLVEVVTYVVEFVTEGGDVAAPMLIDDLVDTYEVEAQEFLEKEASIIEQVVDRIRDAVDAGESGSTLGPLVDELLLIVKNWDLVAQPIQVSTKSRGLPHEASQQVANRVRDLAIDLFNKHNNLELSQKITNMLQEVFAEVVSVADRTSEDAVTLDEIAEQRKLSSLLDPISDLCTKALEGAKRNPSSANREAEQVISAAPRLLTALSGENASDTLMSRGKDEIALTLMQCAVTYGNATRKWKECVSILEDAMKHASSQETRKHVRANLLTASQNKTLYGDLTPISSPPTLWTIYGFGFTLYGSTDVDNISGSHIATYYFTALIFPIFPISRYRVIQNGNSYQFLGKAPLRDFDKVHLAISIGLIIAVIIGAQ